MDVAAEEEPAGGGHRIDLGEPGNPTLPVPAGLPDGGNLRHAHSHAAGIDRLSQKEPIRGAHHQSRLRVRRPAGETLPEHFAATDAGGHLPHRPGFLLPQSAPARRTVKRHRGGEPGVRNEARISFAPSAWNDPGAAGVGHAGQDHAGGASSEPEGASARALQRTHSPFSKSGCSICRRSVGGSRRRRRPCS